jgi:hypothetical protein
VGLLTWLLGDPMSLGWLDGLATLETGSLLSDGLLGLAGLSLDGLLPDELGELSLEDDGDELLSQGQHSPKAITSHLLLSAKCLAMPHVPAGTKSDSSGQPQQQGDELAGAGDPLLAF